MKNPVVQQMKQKQKRRMTVNEQAGHPGRQARIGHG
jgi:hypothetical protein